MLRVLPVTVDHMWLNNAGPELRDSISHPTEPTATTPRISAITKAHTAEDRPSREDWEFTSELPDIQQGYHQARRLHCMRVRTQWVANDNDFLTEVPDDTNTIVPNSNQFFVFGFTDADLAGSKLVPQRFRPFRW
jgi:hypothetical protein